MEKREQHEEISASNVETRTAGSRIFASFAVFAERDFSKFYILSRRSNKTHSNSPKMENTSVAGALPSECYLIKYPGGRATRVCSFQTRSIHSNYRDKRHADTTLRVVFAARLKCPGNSSEKRVRWETAWQLQTITSGDSLARERGKLGKYRIYTAPAARCGKARRPDPLRVRWNGQRMSLNCSNVANASNYASKGSDHSRKRRRGIKKVRGKGRERPRDRENIEKTG